jgi:hypothetical protein
LYIRAVKKQKQFRNKKKTRTNILKGNLNLFWLSERVSNDSIKSFIEEKWGQPC